MSASMSLSVFETEHRPSYELVASEMQLARAHRCATGWIVAHRSLIAVALFAAGCGGIRASDPCASAPCEDVAATGAAGAAGAGGATIGTAGPGGAGEPAGGAGTRSTPGGASGGSYDASSAAATPDASVAQSVVDASDASVEDIAPSGTQDAFADPIDADARDFGDAEICEAGPPISTFPSTAGHRCDGDQPQACVGTHWSDVGSLCAPGLCDFGACCFLSCQGRVITKICALDFYKSVMACPFGCVRGKCTDCYPGQQRCTDAGSQICDFNGEWRTATSCARGCNDAGGCDDAGSESD